MEQSYIVTERAHLMCPDMHFGILCTINQRYDKAKVREGLNKITNAHPFLQSCIADDAKGRPYYQIQKDWSISFQEMHSIEAFENDYNELSERGWDVYKEGLLRVIVYPGDIEFKMLFVAHHLLCDGRGLMGLVMSFADCYSKGTEPVYTKECLIKSFADLPAGSDLPWISKAVISRVNQNWKKENHRVSYKDYLEFERDYVRHNKLNLNFESMPGEELISLREVCHNNNISINDYLIAEMMLVESINKVVIAADVRGYLPHYKEGSMGNYATAFHVTCKSRSNDLIVVAKKVAKDVQKKVAAPKNLMLVLACYLTMDPELIDAVAISTLGKYRSKAGTFVGSRMFGYKDRCGYSITNLGRYESDSMTQATFIPPASPANKKTVGVVTVNEVLNRCTVTNSERDSLV